MRQIYRCTKDVINKKPVISSPYIDSDLDTELVRYVEFYAFVKGFTYYGNPGNHPETREPGVMFSNHQGQEHFISAGFLKEHFEEVEA